MKDGIEARIIEAARTSATQADFRKRALALMASEVAFDAALFHALSPRVPLESGALHAIDAQALAATMPHWDQYAVDLARWRDVAMENGGVAIDTDVFSPGDRKRLAYFRELARPLRFTSGMLVHLTMRERIVSVIGLFRRRTAAFAPRDAERMRALAPLLAVADSSCTSARSGEAVGVPVARVRCVDDRLTPRQRELVERVALGHTNREIAEALDVSENTIRNQLAVVFRKLGAANRAEAVHHAVLR